MASHHECFSISDDDGTKLGLSITRGAPGLKKEFKDINRKVTFGRIVKRTGRGMKIRTLGLKANRDEKAMPLWYEDPAMDGTVQGQFHIPRYEPWHKNSQTPNPYDHYFFPVMQDGFLGFELGERESWEDLPGTAQTMEYNTEHVFEVQQLKSFFGDILSYGWTVGDVNIANILFVPQCNPIRSWPFYESKPTSVAQLLADCLPNHTSGVLNHDFVYLEARVNRVKGHYFYNLIPKALTGSSEKLPSGLVQLKALWSALTTTMLVLQYLNNDSVVSKYNHVSRRIRKMLEEIAKQSRKDRLRSRDWQLWSSWKPLAKTEQLVKMFNASETTFLQEVEIRIRDAVHKGLTRIAKFEPKDAEEKDFHEWCKQKIQSQTSLKTPHSFGLGLYKLHQTKAERENWKLHGKLKDHVTKSEMGELESMEDIDIEDANEDEVGSPLEAKSGSSDWAAGWATAWHRSEDAYENGLPTFDPNDSGRDF